MDSPIAPCRKRITLYINQGHRFDSHTIDLSTSYLKSTKKIEIFTLQKDLAHLINQPFFSLLMGYKTPMELVTMVMDAEIESEKMSVDANCDITVTLRRRTPYSVWSFETGLTLLTEKEELILPEELHFYDIDTSEIVKLMESEPFHRYLNKIGFLPEEISVNSHLEVVEEALNLSNMVIRLEKGPSPVILFQ
jgi:hypothetical protein